LQEKRRINKEIECFRREHQRVEDRRDYDLYDPDALKKLTAPEEDDDRKFGLAAAQKYVQDHVDRNTAIDNAYNEYWQKCLGKALSRICAFREDVMHTLMKRAARPSLYPPVSPA
jgi:hypothetical protein